MTGKTGHVKGMPSQNKAAVHAMQIYRSNTCSVIYLPTLVGRRSPDRVIAHASRQQLLREGEEEECTQA